MKWHIKQIFIQWDTVIKYVFLVILIFSCRSFPKAVPVVQNPKAQQEILVLDSMSQALGQNIKIFVIQTGHTLVTFDQFFSGNDGAIGFSGIWRMKADSRKFWAPVQCFLILHPVHGAILIDTCVSRAQSEKGYYKGLAANVHRDDINRIPPGADLVSQLARLGVKPEDIQHVIITHLHEDHVGGLNHFPHATVYLASDEWENRGHRPFIAPVYYEKNWEKTCCIKTINFDSGRFLPFAASQDLFTDSTIILLPTIGHTMGHLSVLVNAGDHFLFLSGDAFYTLRHLDPDALTAFNPYNKDWQKLYKDSIRQIISFQKQYKNIILIAQHDPFLENHRLLHKTLGDGRLSLDEQTLLLGYQKNLYQNESLKKKAYPKYVPGKRKGDYGRVESELP